MKDRYFEHIVGCLEASIKTAEDGVDCHIPAVTVQNAVDLLKEQDEEHGRLLSWLGKFCRHIDNGDAWLTDEENIAFFKEKMKQQFGWDTEKIAQR